MLENRNIHKKTFQRVWTNTFACLVQEISPFQNISNKITFVHHYKFFMRHVFSNWGWWNVVVSSSLATSRMLNFSLKYITNFYVNEEKWICKPYPFCIRYTPFIGLGYHGAHSKIFFKFQGIPGHFQLIFQDNHKN